MKIDTGSVPKSRSKGAAIVSLLRPREYLKNSFVLAALIFTNTFRDGTNNVRTALAFIAMCLVSSSTYIVNDSFDANRDRAHPKKRFRPIASGEITVRFALYLAIALLISGLLISLYLGTSCLVVVLLYLAIQALYNWKLKREAIADVFTIATGFVLRAVLGAAAIAAPISGWLLFFTGSIALALGFSKRRSEFVTQGENREHSRESLVHYSKEALDAFVAMFAISAALFYAIYSIQSKTGETHPLLPVTVPFVVYGICRYLLLVLGRNEGGDPAEIVSKDPHIIIAIAGFIVTAIVAMSGYSLKILER